MGITGTCVAKGRVRQVPLAPRCAERRGSVVFAHRALGGCVAHGHAVVPFGPTYVPTPLFEIAISLALIHAHVKIVIALVMAYFQIMRALAGR
mmetsp:Transcript_3118/g.3318  ORF Transcript_3118/g.3318 Transcript_3118/m.3318 type:complete len:93 (+) Transcript_3118:365-643(+)